MAGNPFGFAYTLQALGRKGDQVLVLGLLASRQSEGGWFRPGDAIGLFREFRVPEPGNLNQTLADLAKRGLLRRHGPSKGLWSLTPFGRAHVDSLGISLDAVAVERAAALAPGAVLAEGRHAVVPPIMAPAHWLDGIHRFLARHPFERNVFCITRFPKGTEDDHLAAAIESASRTLKSHGLELHRADGTTTVDDLHGNVAAHMWACMYGIAFFEIPLGSDQLNLNVATEVGSMLMTGRRCALLRDATVSAMPSDLLGLIYLPVNLKKPETVDRALHRWAAKDLGLGECSRCG